MNEANQVRELIKNIAGTSERSSHFLCAEVVSVDGETITVNHGKMELSGVKLRAITNSNTNSILVNPSVGSIVLLADLSGGEMRDLSVIGYSEIDSITINGGKNNGLVKVDKLVSDLNKHTKRLNDIVTALSNLAQAMTTSGGSPVLGSALGAAITSAMTGIMTPVADSEVDNLQNEKIKH